MLTWLVRGCVIGAGVMLLAVGFWQTGQWSWCNRLFVAFVRMVCCVVVVLVGIAAGSPVMRSALQASSHTAAVRGWWWWFRRVGLVLPLLGLGQPRMWRGIQPHSHQRLCLLLLLPRCLPRLVGA